ncbi:hypothetical protein BK133_11125 [Paenibacillus sp. FSL H8-0548]|uniref:phage holin, LLH family n=1 Tax=Paenibacillus sp. FSL H8-0548 TaxID=1920422 RepID=UPI00096E11B2|nr:phage holin, LLH family [Paenibacillus sp. FSL H8-0548]OMF35253.1 hypothetical protein BK133_11125 [Paenibacillus sp. FSL H8-0548]
MDILQPYVDTVVQALIGLLVTFIIGVIAMLQGKVKTWLETRTTAQQREVLHRIAGEAVALFEATIGSGSGRAKLKAAEGYVINHLAKIGSSLTATEIKAAIEKAVADYNAGVGKSG